MKIERLSENQLRFTVWTKDLPDASFTISDMIGNQEKTRELIKYMIEKAKEKFGTTIEDYSVIVEAIPVNDDCIIFLLSKLDKNNPDNYTKQLRDIGQKAHETAIAIENGSFSITDDEEEDNTPLNIIDEKPQPEVVPPYRVFTTDNLENLITVADLVKNYYDSDNSLYKNEEGVYFILVSHNRNSDTEFGMVCSTLREFTVPYKHHFTSRYYLDEHFDKIIYKNALQTLSEI